MYFIKLKFDQHADIKRKLIETGKSEIIEDIGTRNGVSHKFWGAKRYNENQFEGQNVMGKLLMELRDEL